MRKLSFLFSVLCLLSSCGRSEVLPKDSWTPVAHSALEELIKTAPADSYAVFDFDNTTIINDISMTLMAYTVDNMRFVFSASEAFEVFTSYIPDTDIVLEGVGRSASELARELADDYAHLQLLKGEGTSVELLRNTPEWKRLKSNLFTLNEGLENTFDYGVWCQWQPSLFKGMTYDELASLTKESVRYWLDEGSMVVPKETLDLFAALRKHSIDVYICSASLEVIVEAMACDPEFGLNFSEDHVFGIRLADTQWVGGAFDPTYTPTFLEGKVACIERFMRPAHNGAAPILVSGDSGGDVAMLSTYSDALRLVYDCNRTGSIAEFISSSQPRCVVQPRTQYSK